MTIASVKDENVFQRPFSGKEILYVKGRHRFIPDIQSHGENDKGRPEKRQNDVDEKKSAGEDKKRSVPGTK